MSAGAASSAAAGLRRAASWGTTTSAASAGVTPGYSALMIATPARPPMIWAAIKGGTEDGAIPAKLLENTRPTVMAGLAKLVEEVKQYAAPM